MKHWPIGGSTAGRTYRCPGWALAASQGFRPAPSGARVVSNATPGLPAKRGTFCHAQLEWLVREALKGAHDWALSDDDITLFVGAARAQALDLTDDPRGYVRDKLGHAFETLGELLQATPAGKVLIEYSIAADWAPEIVGGTVDYAWITDDEIHVLDYKSGDGALHMLPRELPDSPDAYPDILCQLVFYAGMLFDADMVEGRGVCLHALHAHRDTTIHTWLSLTHEQFAHVWEKLVGPAVEDAADMWDAGAFLPGALRPGAHCQYCPTQPFCPALEDKLRAAARAKLTPEALERTAEILELAEALKGLETHAKELMQAALEGGQDVPGWKLVQKRRSRSWLDEAGVLAAFKAQRIDPALFLKTSLLTPAQAEKVCKQHDLDPETLLGEHIALSPTELTIAPESDSRPSQPPLEALIDQLATLEH